jgi:hypothetical protein
MKGALSKIFKYSGEEAEINEKSLMRCTLKKSMAVTHKLGILSGKVGIIVAAIAGTLIMLTLTLHSISHFVTKV